MKQKSFNQLVGSLFIAKVIFGILYLLFNWQVAIAGWVIPMWLILMAIVVDSYLAYLAFSLKIKK